MTSSPEPCSCTKKLFPCLFRAQWSKARYATGESVVKALLLWVVLSLTLSPCHGCCRALVACLFKVYLYWMYRVSMSHHILHYTSHWAKCKWNVSQCALTTEGDLWDYLMNCCRAKISLWCTTKTLTYMMRSGSEQVDINPCFQLDWPSFCSKLTILWFARFTKPTHPLNTLWFKNHNQPRNLKFLFLQCNMDIWLLVVISCFLRK